MCSFLCEGLINQTDLSKHMKEDRNSQPEPAGPAKKDIPFHQDEELYDSVCPWFSLGHSELKCESLKPLSFKGFDAEGIRG